MISVYLRYHRSLDSCTRLLDYLRFDIPLFPRHSNVIKMSQMVCTRQFTERLSLNDFWKISNELPLFSIAHSASDIN